jgi:hypothetical protein
MLFRLLRPAIFALDAERAHRLTIAALKLWAPAAPPFVDGPLATRVAGLTFPNPVGMAAGFDKDAEVPDALLALGFGFAEVGSITPTPSASHRASSASNPPWSRPAVSVMTIGKRAVASNSATASRSLSTATVRPRAATL